MKKDKKKKDKKKKEKKPKYWVCDGCDQRTTDKKNKVYDENFNLQRGVYYCDECSISNY